MDVRVNGLRMEVREAGKVDGPALLLVHGFPLDGRMWEQQLRGLAAHARVLAPDLRGHGQSDATPGPYSMDQHADDLAALLDQLGVHKAILAGLSMGGYVVLAFWRRQPERVAGIVLLDTRAGADTAAGKAGRDATAARVREAGVGVLADDMMPKLLAPQNSTDERITTPLREMILSQPVDGMIGALGALRDRADGTPTLPTITVPTLVIVGEADVITPPTDAERLAAGIPGAQLVVIPLAGHMSPMEEPEAVNRAIVGLIGRATGKP